LKDSYDVIIVGAGAAGMLSGISAAEQGAKVLIIEKMSRPGRKMLISGKGRCNITNTAYQSSFFKKIKPKSKFLKHAFSEFFNKDIIDLLEKNGLKLKEERGGRVFPESDKAEDVVNTLIKLLKNRKVEIRTNTKLKNILIENNEIKGLFVDGKNDPFFCDSIILCTGGKSYPATGSSGDGHIIAEKNGHRISKTFPALVPLETKGNLAQKLQGLSLKNVTASLWVEDKKIKEEFGELLFAHFGLTGPIILTLSRDAVKALHEKHNVEISIDLKPALNEQKLDERLLRELNENGKKLFKSILKNLVPSKLIPVISETTQIKLDKECHQINGKERKELKKRLKDLRFTLTGHRPYKEAIITAGGIDTNEIDSKTMMSKLIKNLYFAGEIIDLDGETGGFNFQIAFSTGWLAGKSASNK
jgi:predicted Rossmann fold flavoprotein